MIHPDRQLPGPTPDNAQVVTFRELIQPLRRHRWLILGLPLVAGAIVAGLTLAIPRSFEARVVLASATGVRNLGPLATLAGAAAGLAGGTGSQSGISVTPDLVVSLIESRRVLTAVGGGAAPKGTGRLIEAVTGSSVPKTDVARRLGWLIRTRIDRENGLVTLLFSHPDSAIARRVVARVLEEVRRAYIDASQSQGRAQRIAQNARVDSALRRLQTAEATLAEFVRSNRIVNEYSTQAIELERQRRNIEIAKQVYMQAMGDREAAIARELQEAPAVVEIDPLPDELPLRPRLLMLKAGLAVIATLLLSITAVYAWESLASMRT